ncbi:hypothetical protein VOLCADRAFT_100470 [Volvox carteri f. nagariensis]|uniref:Uncharacterized protein n=1 Tax=Volvox carteri f. nagariensis TaxID=3068 RepID=D8UK98_VOLCA|nr:uncharacterized protein VOLCADRAFT_100470 [Volvox carteri f. nagariensis]EFJ39844.1 hypothetical protein VOLCADRAFT_100470 [Volvox carteri f. nagariensis]|eukprot:XP_002959081.1 hypothetical protein VOLCADRAFT_100470 [Volvox carteri f. nagariensis]
MKVGLGGLLVSTAGTAAGGISNGVAAAATKSRYGSFIAGVNTAGQGIVIMQIDDVVLGRLESSHAFGHRVTFANVDAASLPPFITSRFAGVTVGQFKVSSATRISVEPSSAVPMLYSARLRFPVYDVGSDRARPEDKHASDGSALLLIPHGGMFRGGPFRKFKAWVACGNGDSPDAGRVELAIRESAPDDFVAQLQAAADSSTPLYVYGAKISPSNSKAYMNSVFLSGSLVAAASAPGKRPPKRVHTFQAAVQRTTAATVPADTTDMVLAWEQRSRSALVLPSDGPHASATLSPNPTSVTVVGSLPVLPLVLTIGSRSYPVCTDSIAVMQQLPNYDEFFGSASFADDNDRMAYAAYDSFTVTGTITTKTEGLGAFRALVGSTPTQVGGVPRIYTAGPTKFATKIACISEQATAAYDMEVAMMAMPTPYVQLWKQAAQQRQPLYSINGRITQKDKWQPVVWLGGVLVTAAYPSKVVRRWVDLASAAIDDQQLPQSVTTTASTGPSTYTHPVLAWERRNATAVVLPADGTHKDMRLQPNLMLEVSVDQQPVIPLVLHRGDNTATYPVCASELAVLQQLPGFQDFFADQDFATTESRQQYVTEEQWTLHCDVKTTTHGRTTFVTDIRPI